MSLRALHRQRKMHAEALQASIPGFVAFFGVVCVAICAMCSAFRLVLAQGIFV
jgi:hypothetical protein